MPLATSDRAMPLSGPAVLDGSGDCVAPALGLSAKGVVTVLGVVCPTLTRELAPVEAAVCNVTELDNEPSGLDRRCEDDGVRLGVARDEGAGLGFLVCECERGFKCPPIFLNFSLSLFVLEDEEDIVEFTVSGLGGRSMLVVGS
jgi:hypothetical protein